MVLMKNIRLSILMIVAGILPSSLILGQDYPAMQQAFGVSYSYESKGEYPKAIDELKKIYREDSYEINVRLGWLSYLSGAFTESTAYYERAITLMPMSIEARMGFALPSSAMGNWHLVIKRYEEILEIDANHSVTNYRLASIYYNRKEYQKACSYLEKIANHYPFDYDIAILYAWTNFQLGKLREARVLFNKALLIRPLDGSAQEGLRLIQ